MSRPVSTPPITQLCSSRNVLLWSVLPQVCPLWLCSSRNVLLWSVLPVGLPAVAVLLNVAFCGACDRQIYPLWLCS